MALVDSSPVLMIAGMLTLGIGCVAPTTVVRFTEPAGATLVYRKNAYVFPADVALRRPTGIGDVFASDIRMTLPRDGATIAVEGKIYVHGYVEQDVDRFSSNKCAVDSDNIRKLQEGSALVVHGTSASNQLQYRMVLGKAR